jgi:hypothetical protein
MTVRDWMTEVVGMLHVVQVVPAWMGLGCRMACMGHGLKRGLVACQRGVRHGTCYILVTTASSTQV